MSAGKSEKFRFEPLDRRKHNRAAFSCENESLTAYIKERASQDLQKNIAAVYVMTADGETIAGYYTLSQYSIDAGDIEETVRRLRIPRYKTLPATLLGRLARDVNFKGKGLGELLLISALNLALQHSRTVASLAVVVEAIDERARHFYRSYGFIDIPSHANRLFLPMKTIETMFTEDGTVAPSEGSPQTSPL